MTLWKFKTLSSPNLGAGLRTDILKKVVTGEIPLAFESSASGKHFHASKGCRFFAYNWELPAYN